MNLFFRRFRPMFLVFCLFSALCFSSCAPTTLSPLSWNREELSFVGCYEENGVTFTARFRVSPLYEGRGTAPLYGRTATATLLSPEAVVGMTYTVDSDGYSVERDGERFSLTTCPAPMQALLLLFPVDATLDSVETEGDTRRETVYAADGTYTYVYPVGEGLPMSVTKTHGPLHASLTVTAWE